MIHRRGMCALQESFLYSCFHLPLSIFTIICLCCVPSLLLWSYLSPCLYLLLSPLLPFSPVSSGVPSPSPAQELPFLLTVSIWCGLLALPSAEQTLTQGPKEQGSPCIHFRLALSLLGYCPDSASRNGLSWIFLRFLSLWSYYHTRLISVCVPRKMLWDKMCY